MNAYGLTETSSTIAVLGPDDHRTAFASDDPDGAGAPRFGRPPLPGVEVSIRDAEGAVLSDGEVGEIWVRGEQVSGEYLGRTDTVDDGWFNTRDAGQLDGDGYLFVHGRLDDVIVRGGENLSPGEIEDVLLEHPAVRGRGRRRHPRRRVGRAGGRRRGARARGARRPRTSCAATSGAGCARPERRSGSRSRDELPFNETGKLLRRVLRDELGSAFGAEGAPT